MDTSPSSQGVHLVRAWLLPPSVTSSGFSWPALDVGQALATAHLTWFTAEYSVSEFSAITSTISGTLVAVTHTHPILGLQQTQLTGHRTVSHWASSMLAPALEAFAMRWIYLLCYQASYLGSLPDVYTATSQKVPVLRSFA